MSSTTIWPAQPEQILKGLGKLWTSLAEEERHHGKPTVLRACAMTLIIATDETDSGFSASQIISELMHEHPSRGIVIAVSDKAEHDIEARVLAQCWKPFGKAQQICCEQIEITTRSHSWPNVAPTLVGLTAADLPVVLWCRHKAALSPMATRHQIAGLEAVMNLASKVIVDTRGEDLTTCFDLLTEWRAKKRVVADLEWTRLTPWRQPIAQIFDNAAREVPFSHFHHIEVEYSGDSPCAAAYYIAGWLAAPHHARAVLKHVDGFDPGLHAVTLIADEERIRFERNAPDSMTLSSTNGRSRTYSYAERPLATLMNEELSVTGGDPVFDRVFPHAKELARGHR